MKTWRVATAVFLDLSRGQTLARQQPVIARKTSPGTIQGPSALMPANAAIPAHNAG